MTDWTLRFLREIAVLFAEATPWLLVGFLLAGLMKVLVPPGLVLRHLGGRGLKSVILAAVYGTPIPLCSCSVIPTATALKKAGASRGATTSFLISTPETGVDSISVTYALLDPIMTVVRPVAAFVTAIATGGLVQAFTRDEEPEAAESAAPEADVDACCDAGDHEHADVDWEGEELHRRPLGERLRLAVRYAFGPLLDDLTPWFVLGFLVSGLIATLVPADLFTEVVPRGWPAMLLMMVVGTPMYICATASTPVAAALIAKGLEPGAALVFLLVGPATNVTTLFVVASLLGRRTLVLYLVGIAGFALVAGLAVNAIYAGTGTDLAARVSETLATGPGPLSIAAGVVFGALLVRSSVRVGLLARTAAALDRLGAPIGLRVGPRSIQVLVSVLALGTWGATALTVVQPGEVGFRTRFGRVVETWDEPGAHLHLPAPFERVERVRPGDVRGLALGFGPRPPAPGEDVRTVAASERERLESEAEVLTGDGNLLAVSYAVHVRSKDAFRARYAVTDGDRLARAFAESALRTVVGQRATGDVLVGRRSELEREAADLLQADLDEVGSGLEVVRVLLRDVHAPDDVHPAYRDVASALEDKERSLHEAEGYQAAQVSGSRAGARHRELRAEAARKGTVDRAAGEAQAFVLLAEEYHRHPALTRLRLYLDATQTALGKARVVVLLGDDVDVEILDVSEGNERAPVVLDDRWGEDE